MAKVTEGKPTDFIPDKDNANQGTQRGQKMIQDSLQEDGAGRGIVVDKNDNVVAGNKTIESAVAIGIDKAIIIETTGNELVITKRLDWDLYEDESPRRYAFRDNRSSEVSLNWNPEQLLLDKEAGVDFSGLFYENEFNELTKDVKQEPPPDPGDPPVNLAGEAQKLWQVKKGDVWQLGRHKIACIDSLDGEAVKGLIDGAKVGMVWADPPYGIDLLKNKKIGQSGAIQANIYKPMVGDEDTITAKKSYMLNSSIFDAVMIYWGGNYYLSAFPDGCSCIVWDKEIIGENYSDCELAFVNRPGRIAKFTHQWHGMIKASEHGQRRIHPTQKPVVLFEWAANKYFKEGGIVFDPFLGSGISVIGAENIGDKISVIGCELSLEYIAVVIQRWVDLTDGNPVCVSFSR